MCCHTLSVPCALHRSAAAARAGAGADRVMAVGRAVASSLLARLLVSLEGKDGRGASRFGRNVHRPCGGTGRDDGFGSSLPAAPGGRRAGSPSKLDGPAAGVIPTG